jgi:transposase-like protein
VVHKQRNVLNAVPHRERQEVSAELLGIWKQEKKEDALVNLEAVYQPNIDSVIPKRCLA